MFEMLSLLHLTISTPSWMIDQMICLQMQQVADMKQLADMSDAKVAAGTAVCLNVLLLVSTM